MKRSNLDHWICQREALPELTREGLQAVQLKKWNAMLRRLKARGGFYRELPEKIASLEEVRTLPFTTEEDLRNHAGQFLVCSQAEVARIITGETSGTTGRGKRVFYTQADLDRTVSFYAAGIGEMLEMGEKCLIAFPFSGAGGLGELIEQAVSSLGGQPVRGCWGGAWGDWRALIEREKPECYIGFPVFLLGLARMYGSDFPVKKALVSGDACPDGVIRALETILGNKTYPHYGSRECAMAGAITCPAFAGMHLRENDIFAEIVDEGGNPVPDGESGELVISTIGAEAMPLVRYRTGDVTRLLPGCSCGSVTRRLGKVSRPGSVEALDGRLFALDGVVDARFAGNQALVRVTERSWEDAVRKALPGWDVRVELCSWEDGPLYLGKRVIGKELSIPSLEGKAVKDEEYGQ